MNNQTPPSDPPPASPLSILSLRPEMEAAGDEEVVLSGKIKEQIEGIFTKTALKTLFWVVSVVIAAFVGATWAVVWELNGKIYEAVGKQSASNEISVFQTQQLEKQIQDLNSKLYYFECLNDIKIKDKAGCYKR